MLAGKIRPLIIPVFIPFQGCPHRCVFCDQERISSQRGKKIDKDHVERILKQAIHSDGFDPRRSPEVAFYGGTFTNLPLDQIEGLLEAVTPFIEQKIIHRIRVSTRPDSLDEKRLKAMKQKGVFLVELGAQSMDNRVLDLSERGHSAEDTVSAVELLKKYGFEVGIQLMPGLPGDSSDRFYSTVKRVLELRPHVVRLYPAVVIRGTGLADLYDKGSYNPLGLDEAVDICMESCIQFENEGIPVIRIGLMSSPSLLEKGQVVAGPWHPAFGFLVRSAIYQRCIEPQLSGLGKVHHITIKVPGRDIPLIRGYRNQGLEKIKDRTGATVVKVKADDSMPEGQIKVERI